MNQTGIEKDCKMREMQKISRLQTIKIPYEDFKLIFTNVYDVF